MLIEIHKNRLKKLAKQLRSLSDEFLKAIEEEEKINPPKTKVPNLIQLHRDGEIKEVLAHYKEVHPKTREVKRNSASWKLVDKKLTDGYTVKELTLAIDNNCNPELSDWWCERGLHSISNVFGKDHNLDKFIHAKKRGNNGNSGYSPGSEDFTGDAEGFGE
jgi:hypothetical protein